MKKLFGISLLMFLMVWLAGCHDGLKLKVYFLDSMEKNALVRKQTNEVRQYAQSFGYQCTSPADFDELMFLLAECRGSQSIQDEVMKHVGGTVYSLSLPAGGLETNGQVITFADAYGYLCLSPPDFVALVKVIENCK